MPDASHPRRVLGFLREQPAALAATWRALAQERPRLAAHAQRARQVVLVGSGTSKNALVATAPAFARAHRAPARVLGPLEFLDDDADLAGALVVVVSQTGSSTTSVAALEAALARAAADARVWAVTAEPGSPFGRAARAALHLPIGPEPIGPKTKGYTATLAALLELAAATAGAATPLPGGPDAAAAWFAQRLRAWEAWGGAWAARWHDVDQLMAIGRGRHVGTALEASLKLQEMAGLPASAFDLEEALHGRFHGLGPRSLAAFVVGERADERDAVAAAEVLRDLGVPSLVASTLPPDDAPAPAGVELVRLGRPPGGDADLDVVSAVVAFQAFAEHAAHRRGVDPDAMRYPGLSARLGIKLPSA